MRGRDDREVEILHGDGYTGRTGANGPIYEDAYNEAEYFSVKVMDFKTRETLHMYISRDGVSVSVNAHNAGYYEVTVKSEENGRSVTRTTSYPIDRVIIEEEEIE